MARHRPLRSHCAGFRLTSQVVIPALLSINWAPAFAGATRLLQMDYWVQFQ